MTSIVRIKRPLNQEPLDALQVAAKRLRVDGDAADATPAKPLQAVFKFCGTAKVDALEDVAELVAKAKSLAHRRTGAKEVRSKPPVRPSAVTTSDKKFKVLSSLRKLEGLSDLQVVDLVEDGELESRPREPEVVTCNGVPLVVEQAPQYVYDYYYAEGGTSIDASYFDQLLSFQPYYEEHGTGSDEEDFGNGEDEDSNDENYYANDYPDEDPDGDCCGEEDDEDDFVAERELTRRMGAMGLGGVGDDDEYPYDDEDDGLVYSLHTEDSYSAFKKRIVKQLMKGDPSSSDDEESDD